jgi:hypothetical protein
VVDYLYIIADGGWAASQRVGAPPPSNGPRADPPPSGGHIIEPPYPLNGTRQTHHSRQQKYPPTAVIRLKATYTDPPTMARSKSKNKTLAVGDTAHARISEIQKSLGLKNHDETIRHLLDYYCSNPHGPQHFSNPTPTSISSRAAR